MAYNVQNLQLIQQNIPLELREAIKKDLAITENIDCALQLFQSLSSPPGKNLGEILESKTKYMSHLFEELSQLDLKENQKAILAFAAGAFFNKSKDVPIVVGHPQEDHELTVTKPSPEKADTRQETFLVNPLMASLESPYFQQLFFNKGFNQNLQYSLPEIEPKIFALVSQYMEVQSIEGASNLTAEELIQLFHASDYLDIPSLKTRCVSLFDATKKQELFDVAHYMNSPILLQHYCSLFNQEKLGSELILDGNSHLLELVFECYNPAMEEWILIAKERLVTIRPYNIPPFSDPSLKEYLKLGQLLQAEKEFPQPITISYNIKDIETLTSLYVICEYLKIGFGHMECKVANDKRIFSLLKLSPQLNRLALIISESSFFEKLEKVLTSQKPYLIHQSLKQLTIYDQSRKKTKKMSYSLILEKHQKITHLTLNRLLGKDIKAVCNLRELIHLNLDHSPITKTQVSKLLEKCHQLTHLSLINIALELENTLKALLQYHPKIEELRLDILNDQDYAILLSYLDKFKNLKTLNLRTDPSREMDVIRNMGIVVSFTHLPTNKISENHE